jgi:hypothetical protein
MTTSVEQNKNLLIHSKQEYISDTSFSLHENCVNICNDVSLSIYSELNENYISNGQWFKDDLNC